MFNDFKDYLARDDRFPLLTFLVIAPLYTLFAYWRTGADNADLWYLFSFFEDWEMSYDWIAVFITGLFFTFFLFRFLLLYLFPSSDSDEYIDYMRLFRYLLIGSFVAFILDSLLIAGVDSQTSLMGHAIRRFIVSGTMIAVTYFGYTEFNEDKALALPCSVLMLFQMILDLTWTLSLMMD